MSETSVSTQPQEEAQEQEKSQEKEEEQTQSLLEKMRDLFKRKIAMFRQSVFPEPTYIEGEEVKQTIHMATYRATIPRVLGVLGAVFLGVALPLFVFVSVAGSSNGRMVAGGVLLLALYTLYKASQTWVTYHQWKFIITDRRVIITTPDPDHAMFADIIYLQTQNNNIKVLDANFSENPAWRMLQIASGARDVMLSMGGYEFTETGAKVKGGLRFPDVPLEDIKRLEQLFFG